jgi:hypothetical protein
MGIAELENCVKWENLDSPGADFEQAREIEGEGRDSQLACSRLELQRT